MAIPWLIGAAVAAGVGAILASDDDDSSSSSSSSRDLDRERERARRDNERKKEEKEKQVKEQRIASENRAKAQRFITKHKLNLTPDELICANKQDNQLSLQVLKNYDNKANVRRRNRDIKLLEQELKDLEIVENELLGMM